MDFKRAALVIVCHYQGSDRNRKTTYNMPRSFLVRGRQSSSGPTEKSSNTSKEKISGERITRQIMCLEYIYIYIFFFFFEKRSTHNPFFRKKLWIIKKKWEMNWTWFDCPEYALVLKLKRVTILCRQMNSDWIRGNRPTPSEITQEVSNTRITLRRESSNIDQNWGFIPKSNDY